MVYDRGEEEGLSLTFKGASTGFGVAPLENRDHTFEIAREALSGSPNVKITDPYA